MTAEGIAAGNFSDKDGMSVIELDREEQDIPTRNWCAGVMVDEQAWTVMWPNPVIDPIVKAGRL